MTDKTVQQKLEDINALYGKCIKANDKFVSTAKECVAGKCSEENVADSRKEADQFGNEFDNEVNALNGQIQFDMIAGEYIPLYDEEGNRIFRVAVEMRQFGYVDITADSLDAAKRQAIQMMIDGEVKNVETEFNAEPRTCEA